MPVTFDYLNASEKRVIRQALIARKEQLKESIRRFKMLGDSRETFCERDLKAVEKLLEKFQGSRWS